MNDEQEQQEQRPEGYPVPAEDTQNPGAEPGPAVASREPAGQVIEHGRANG